MLSYKVPVGMLSSGKVAGGSVESSIPPFQNSSSVGLGMKGSSIETFGSSSNPSVITIHDQQ